MDDIAFAAAREHPEAEAGNIAVPGSLAAGFSCRAAIARTRPEVRSSCRALNQVAPLPKTLIWKSSDPVRPNSARPENPVWSRKELTQR